MVLAVVAAWGIWAITGRGDTVTPIIDVPAVGERIDVAAEDVPPRPDDAIALTVASVWDGDTLRATANAPSALIDTRDEIRVRLIGIDTPERSPDEECWALESRDHLADLLPPGSTVWAAPDQDPLDRYERWLFYLWTEDGRFVNYELVAAGDAEPLRVEPNVTYDPLFVAATAQAQATDAGQWGACG